MNKLGPALWLFLVTPKTFKPNYVFERSNGFTFEVGDKFKACSRVPSSLTVNNTDASISVWMVGRTGTERAYS